MSEEEITEYTRTVFDPPPVAGDTVIAVEHDLELEALARAHLLIEPELPKVSIERAVQRSLARMKTRPRGLFPMVVALAGLAVFQHPSLAAVPGECATVTTTAPVTFAPRTALERVLNASLICERRNLRQCEEDLGARSKQKLARSSTVVQTECAAAPIAIASRPGLSTVEWVVVISSATAIIGAILGYALARETEPAIRGLPGR